MAVIIGGVRWGVGIGGGGWGGGIGEDDWKAVLGDDYWGMQLVAMCGGKLGWIWQNWQFDSRKWWKLSLVTVCHSFIVGRALFLFLLSECQSCQSLVVIP